MNIIYVWSAPNIQPSPISLAVHGPTIQFVRFDTSWDIVTHCRGNRSRGTRIHTESRASTIGSREPPHFLALHGYRSKFFTEKLLVKICQNHSSWCQLMEFDWFLLLVPLLTHIVLAKKIDLQIFCVLTQKHGHQLIVCQLNFYMIAFDPYSTSKICRLICLRSC